MCLFPFWYKLNVVTRRYGDVVLSTFPQLSFFIIPVVLHLYMRLVIILDIKKHGQYSWVIGINLARVSDGASHYHKELNINR